MLAPSRNGLRDCKDCDRTKDLRLWHSHLYLIAVALTKEKVSFVDFW